MNLKCSINLLLGFLLVEIVLELTLDPEALLANSIFAKEVAFTVLFALFPSAFVFSTVAPNEFTLTMAFVVLELANVLIAARVNYVSVAVHFVFKPLAFIFLLIGPDVNTLTFYLIRMELSLIYCAVSKI